MDDPRAGQILGDRYRLERKLGQGGMGQVYLARHLRTGRPCAVKLLSPETASRREAILRFQQEAQVLGALGHPGIVGIHDFAEAPDGQPYMVMDYLEGEDLADRLARERPLPLAAAQRILSEIGAALSVAHRSGIVHRDLKPGNVFLTRTPGAPERVVLLDFGLAKNVSAESLRLTETGAIVGTPLYMSPEHARGLPLDPRSDEYALAAICFEMLSGEPPFTGPNWTAVLSRLLVDPPPLLSARVPSGLPPHLDEVLIKALAKRPEDRYPDVAAFVAAVLGDAPAWTSPAPDAVSLDTTLAAPPPSTGPRPALPAAPGSGPQVSAEVRSAPRPAASARRRERPVHLLMGLGALAAAGLAALLIVGAQRSRRAEPDAAPAPGHARADVDASPPRAPWPDAGPARNLPVDAGLAMLAPVRDAGAGSGPAPAMTAPRPAPPRTGPPPPRLAPPLVDAGAPAGTPGTMPTPPAGVLEAVARIEQSDYLGCLRIAQRAPPSVKTLQLQVTCGSSAGRPADVRRACQEFARRFPRHPFNQGCAAILKAQAAAMTPP
jgi:serine/threonine-protein kinase